ncbi:MAG: hypothetical protein AAGA03_15705 [Planctomycetota bacterium]
MVKADVWRVFVRECASLLLAGQLTNEHLRQAIKDPHLRNAFHSYSFRLNLVSACEQVRPSSTRNPALMLEIDAADRRIRKFLDSGTRLADSIRPSPSGIA